MAPAPTRHNGALKTDLANDLSLENNAAGLTTAVRNAAGTQLKLSFVYDEQGQRVRKVEYTAGVASKTTLYLRGPEGGLGAVYEAPAAGAYVQKELLLDGGALGAYFGDQVNRYVYALTDHLGNVRATVDRDLSGGAVQQLSYADYYAWGMPLPGREAASSPRYRLGYQGQEYESKVGLYGFGLRLYDQRLGRWLSADPYGQHWSPYLAMSNNPVSFVDADGGWDYSQIRVDWLPLFDNAEYDWYSYNNRWGAFTEWSGSRFNSVLNPVQKHDYSQMSKEILRVSEQVAPDDIYMYIGGAKVKVSSFGGRDFTLTYGSDGALLASESRFPAVMVPQYREMVSGIPISKMTPAELLVAQALEVPVSAGYEEIIHRYHQNLEYQSYGGADWGYIGNVLGSGGVAFSALENAVANQYWWMDAKGNYKSTNILEKGANGKYIRGVQGYRNGYNSALKAASGYKIAGNIIGGLGLLVTAVQLRENKITVTEAAVDALFGVVGFLGPVGAGISAIYFIGKNAYEQFSGETVFEKPR